MHEECIPLHGITNVCHACRRKSVLELALRQSGCEAAKAAADMAERVAKREGTGAGVIKVPLCSCALGEFEGNFSLQRPSPTFSTFGGGPGEQCSAWP